nr:glycosyltransferase family 52 protein [Acinetobacter baumannii]
MLISYVDNDKYRFYFDKISAISRKSWFFKINSTNKFSRMMDMIKLKKIIREFDPHYNIVYFASLDNAFLHLVVSNISFNSIETFDDGSANINKDSTYFKGERKSSFQLLFSALLGIKFNKSIILDKIYKHYSIFEGYSNIVPNVEYIKIFESENLAPPNKVIKIFLGQPFEEMGFIDKEELYLFLRKIGIDYYFPHPREKHDKDFYFEIVQSKLIFEEFILELLTDGNLIEVYTLLSTAGLNVSMLDYVTVKVIRSKDLYMRYSSLYKVFQDMKVEFIDFDGISL